MAPGERGQSTAGRADELADLAAGLRLAANGQSRTLVVTGTTGVGKTALVRDAVEEGGRQGLVLAGACLPLRHLSVPLQPLRSALREAEPPGHQACLDAMEVPDHAPRALDAYLDEVAATGPVILFVDDIQWADRSTLDVLLYLAAGPSDRRLALVVAARDEGLPDGHPLHRWLADVERLPRVSRLRLQSLDRRGTKEQIETLLGAAPHQSLVEDAFARAGGNPYLTSLLVRGLPPTARGLPADLPDDLTAAVKRDWHDLGESARRATSLVAVAGRPVTMDLLEAVAQDLGVVGDVPPALEEAVERRVLRQEDPAGYWFHHPLQAEVLEQALGAPRRRAWHAAYARQLEARAATMTLPTAVALSDHHHRAADAAAAYSWALQAWEVAGPARGSPELRRLLQRAIELRPQLPDEAESTQELLERLRASAEAAGDFGDELAAVEALLDVVDEREDPLSASALRVRRSRLQTFAGAGAPAVDDAGQAVVLAAAAPASWQHALALAELARAAMWADDPQAGEAARRAVSIARAAGRPGPLSYALTASAMVALQEGDHGAAVKLSREAGRLALKDGDWMGFTSAVIWESNARAPQQSEDTADLLRHRRHELSAADAPHVFPALLGANEGQLRVVLGDWRGCADLLRVTLGSDLGVFVDVNSRLAAALLDAWQGRPRQATMHLDRAAELLTGPGSHAGLPLSAARAVVALATGNPVDAYQAALDGARAPGAAPHMCEWLIPLAARALADLAEADADAGRAGSGSTGGPETGDVDALVQEFPRIVTDPGFEQFEQSRAMQAWYDAEVGRVRRSEGLGRRWWSVAESCAAADLPWVEAYAWWRSAEAYLARGRDERRHGIDAWRRAVELAGRLQAAPIVDELETLGRVARVPSHPDAEASKEAADSLPGVTPREREILAELVAGSTYAEIAAALVISEKTVSSHVSNLLRKTGTANRVELARLVTRVGLEVR